MVDFTKYKQEVESWRKQSLQELDAQFGKLDIVHRSYSPSPYPAREVLKAIAAYKNGLPTKVSFKFPRHMVFVQKGVGKGVPIGIAGSGATKRKPKDWFNGVMDRQTENLADIVAENTADFLVANIGIK